MCNGYWQKTLRVNLTTGDIRVETIQEKDLKAFIGGAGLGAEILLREIPEKIDPLSPENLVIFATGPFQGPSVPGGAKFSVVGISPLTGTYADTAAGGSWGPSIKDAGFDMLVLEGKSPKPVYLQIVDDNVQIKDAAAIWGKDTLDSIDAILKETGDDKLASQRLDRLANVWLRLRVSPWTSTVLPDVAVLVRSWAARISRR